MGGTRKGESKKALRSSLQRFSVRQSCFGFQKNIMKCNSRDFIVLIHQNASYCVELTCSNYSHLSSLDYVYVYVHKYIWFY